MPRLPSSGDVQTVPPRVTSDPGVSVPAQAFESPLGAAAQEFVPAVETFAKVAKRQEDRRDAVDRSSRINQYTRDAELELRRLNTEADLSDESVLSSYGSFLSERRQKLIEEHGGSEDSRATLLMRLGDVESEAVGKAAGLSTSIGRKKVTTTFNNALSPLVQSAAQQPTLENMDKLFLGLETQIGDIQAALDPNEEEDFRTAGREQIVRSAVDTLIARGRIETAEGLLTEGNLIQHLPPDAQREVRRKIETVRFAKDEVLRKMSQAEAVLGRPLKDKERLQLLGFTNQDTELVEVGDLNSPTGTRFVPKSMAVGKPGKPNVPSGFQLTRDPRDPNAIRLQPIPGSAEDVKRKQEARRLVEQQKTTARQARVVVRDIDRSLSIIDNAFLGTGAGPIAGTVGRFNPASSVFQLNLQLESIKSRITFDTLQQLRAISPTGGALGQVSDREGALLGSALGSLDVRQDEEILKENLNQIRDLFLDAWFGTPEEHQAAIDEGRMTPEQAAQLQKERESVKFDAIGKAIDAMDKQTEALQIDEDDIMAMTREQVLSMPDNQLDEIEGNPKLKTAMEKRLKELSM